MIHFLLDPRLRLWNLFDLALVLLMIVDCWVLTYLVEVEAQQLQLLSGLRLLRLLRISRILRMVPELGMMVKSMFAALRSVTSTCILAVGVMYIFAIMLTQWVKGYGSEDTCIGDENEICLKEYFGTIMLSFLSLTQILVFDDTFEVVRPVFKEQMTVGFLLVVYMLLVSFTVLNMLIGIICDIVSETCAGEKEKMQQRRVEELFLSLDADGNGQLSRQEFEESGAMAQLRKLGIDDGILKNAFDILDTDGDGKLESREFAHMIFKCIHPPQSQDILEIENKVDLIADVCGFDRKAIGIFQHSRTNDRSVASEKALAEGVPDGSEKERALGPGEDPALLGRLAALGRRLGDLALAAEAMPTAVRGAGGATHDSRAAPAPAAVAAQSRVPVALQRTLRMIT